MPLLNPGCSICLDSVPISDLRALRCGHCFCTTCIENIDRCGVCRGKKGTLRPVFIHDAGVNPDDEALRLSSQLEDMALGCSTSNVKAATSGAKRMALACGNLDPSLASRLDSAISTLEDRIEPMSAFVEILASENATLKVQLERAQSRAALCSKQKKELKQVKDELAEMTKSCNEAKKKGRVHKERVDSLEEQLKRKRRALSKSEEAVRDLESDNESLEEEVVSLKKKLKVLGQSHKEANKRNSMLLDKFIDLVDVSSV